MSVGFIRDKLEIKFLILYIMARVGESVPLAELQELTMCDDGIDYFDFAECLNDLVATEHLRLENESYTITPKGLRNSEICESSLPYSVRIRADKNLYTFLAGDPSGEFVTVGTGRTQLLSTEAMPCTFTGCFAGMFAEGDSEAEFRYFSTEEA